MKVKSARSSLGRSEGKENPKEDLGLKAQGCEERATLGETLQNDFINPNRGCVIYLLVHGKGAPSAANSTSKKVLGTV
jgi:hypothetical protein